MGHNVGDAAKAAVQRSERKADVKLTPLELIQALRNNLRANLFIPSHQTIALLEQYDLTSANLANTTVDLTETKMLVVNLETEIERLKSDIEQFRSVYEQENRTTTVQVARSEEGETKVVETIAVDGPVPPFLPEVVNSSLRGIA